MKKTDVPDGGQPAMPPISFEISATFAKEYKVLKKKYPSLPADIDGLKGLLKKNPQSGDALGDDCYKIRLAISSKNAGKSGGARVITCVKIVASTIFLLSIFDKSGQETISKESINAILKTVLR